MVKNIFFKLVFSVSSLMLSMHFSLQAQDAGITSVLSPLENSCGTTSGILKVIVFNFGSSSISNVPVKATSTGSSAFSLLDTLKRTIAAGKQDTLSFKSTINILNGGTFNFKIYSLLSGDLNFKNDTLSQSVDIIPFPATPTATGGSRCGAGTLVFKAPSITAGSTTYWYTNNSSGTMIGKGDTISKSISSTTTLYATSVTGSKFDSLSTTFAAGASHVGNMFDVSMRKTINIDSFDVSFNVKGGDTIEFYYKSGTYVGYEAKQSAWTLVGKKFTIPAGGGSGVATCAFSGSPLILKAGNLYGIYIRANTKTKALLMTTNSDSFYNSDMIIYAGKGVAGNFGATVTPREWNGRFYYSKPSCSSPFVAVTGVVNEVVKSLVFTKNLSSSGLFNYGNASNPDQICVGDSLKYELSTPSNFSNSDYGSKWHISYLIKTAAGTSAANYFSIDPSSSSKGGFAFIPKTGEEDSTFVLAIKATNMISGCDTNFMRYIHVNEHPSASFSVSSNCMNKPLNISNSSTPASGINYTWYFGNGDSSIVQAPTYYYKSSGTYTVTLIVSNGVCSSLDSKIANAYTTPSGSAFIKSFPFQGAFNKGDYIDPDNLCATDTNTYQVSCPKGLSNSDFGTKWTITSVSFKTAFNNFSPDTIFKKPTSIKNAVFQFFPSKKFTDSVLILNIFIRTLPGNCDTVMTRYIHVRQKAVSKFGFTNACMGNPLIFKDSSTTSNPKATQWNWNFGDGQTSVQENPAHNYAIPGSYLVQLNATTDFGCGILVSHLVQQYPAPQTKFIAAPACNLTSSVFLDSSFISNGTISTWNWTFGDGAISNLKNPTHPYSGSGPYNVKLVTVSSYGCKDSFQKKILILPRPVAKFSWLNACVGTNIYFANNSIDSVSGSIYSWDFGDGNKSAIASPGHKFASSGTYKTTLKITSKNGCSDTLSTWVRPYELPTPEIFVFGGCPGEMVNFADSSKAPTGSLYSWMFGDGGNDYGKSSITSHTYINKGSYSVKLTITNPSGCSDSQRKIIQIADIPKSAFTVNNICLGNMAQFANISSGTGTLSYNWYFGDNSMGSTAASPSYLYSKAGTYHVKLSAINSGGCTDTAYKDITVYPIPAIPKWHVHQNKYTVSFIPDDTGFAGYKWFFGTTTNDSSSQKFPTFTYPGSGGNFKVKLIASNSFGCSSQKTDSVYNFTLGTREISDNISGIIISPNPFEGKTNISYAVAWQTKINLSVYDLQGWKIATLYDGIDEAGTHMRFFDAKKYPAKEGLYFLKLTTNDGFIIEKMVISK